jgi:hypothetical protein
VISETILDEELLKVRLGQQEIFLKKGEIKKRNEIERKNQEQRGMFVLAACGLSYLLSF